MSKPALSTALLHSIALSSEDGSAPEWIHLLPAGMIETVDDRGPYQADDLDAIIAASMADTQKLPIDQDHATDLAAPNGAPAPARGWIVQMDARDDGIWGQVEWTPTGNTLLAEKAYRGISPVILHDDDKNVFSILRASLVNNPNFAGLKTLHSQNQPKETGMDLLKKIAEMLGMDVETHEEQLMSALQAKLDDASDDDTSAELQSTLDKIGEALKVDASDGDALVTAVQSAASSAKTDVPALQGQVAGLTKEVTDLKDAGKKDKAVAFVDGAISQLRIGLNSENRDEYVQMHIENPGRTEKLVNAMPCLNSRGQPETALQQQSTADLSTADVIARANAYIAKQSAAGATVNFTAACLAVREGKDQ